MVQVVSLRIVIMELITLKTKVLASPKSDTFHLVLDITVALSKELKVQGANLMITLGHLDYVQTWN